MPTTQAAIDAEIRRAWRTGPVMLVGPAGIGRTAQLARIVSRSRSATPLVLRGSRALRAIAGGAAAAAGIVPPGQGERELAAHLARELSRQPLAIDDAHLLDDLSLAVVASARVPALMSASSEAPWPSELQRLAHVARRFDGAPLDLAEFDALVRQGWGAAPDRLGLHQLHQACGGRPGRLAVVLELLGPPSRDDRDRPLVPTAVGAHPALVAWAVDAMAHWGDEERRALRLLAGRDALPARVVAAACGDQALGALAASRVISADGDGGWRVADPLLRTVLAEGIAPAHQRTDAVAVLEAMAERDAPAAMLARWELAAGRAADVEGLTAAMADALVGGDLRAADRIAAALAHHDDAAAVGLRAEHLAAAGRTEEAMELAQRAAAAGRPAVAGRGRLLVTDLLLFRLSDARAAATVLARSGTVDAASGQELDALAGLVRNIVGDAVPVTTGHRVDGTAADATMDLPPYAALLTDLGRVLSARVAPGERLSALADSVPVLLRSRARTNATLSAFISGTLAEAQDAAREQLADALSTGRHGAVGLALGMLGMVHQAAGRLEAGLEDADEGLACLAVDDESGVLHVLEAMRASILAERGDVEAARASVAALEATADIRVALQAGGARVRIAAAMDRDEAGDLAVRLMQRGAAQGNVAWSAHLGLHAVRAGVRGPVPSALAALVVNAQGPVMSAIGALAGGLTVEDASAVRDAGDALAASGWVRAAADAWIAAGDLERHPDQAARDRRRAASAVQRLGPPVLLDTPPPLTERERQVASAASGGATSATIAARLGISVRTVDNHLRTVYQKMGVRGRGELQATLLE